MKRPRAAVSLALDLYDPSTQVGRDLLRTVCASVVSNDNFASNAFGSKKPLNLLDTGGEGLGLVEAWHHDREFNRITGVAVAFIHRWWFRKASPILTRVVKCIARSGCELDPHA